MCGCKLKSVFFCLRINKIMLVIYRCMNATINNTLSYVVKHAYSNIWVVVIQSDPILGKSDFRVIQNEWPRGLHWNNSKSPEAQPIPNHKRVNHSNDWLNFNTDRSKTNLKIISENPNQYFLLIKNSIQMFYG